MKKMTKREKFEMLLAIPSVQENELLVEFINHELELLAKKNGKSANGEKSLTVNQKVNEEIKAQIVEFLRGKEPMQIKEMKIGNFSSQKISALVKQLVENGIVERTEVKKVALFGLIEVEEVQEEE